MIGCVKKSRLILCKIHLKLSTVNQHDQGPVTNYTDVSCVWVIFVNVFFTIIILSGNLQSNSLLLYPPVRRNINLKISSQIAS